MILSAQDLEVAVVSPIAESGKISVVGLNHSSASLVPRVGDEPVFGSILNSPAEDADGVSAESLAGHVLVNARLVLHEVLVDGESSFDGAVGHDFGLDVILVALDGVAGLAEVLVSLEVHFVVRVQALVLALGRGAFAAARHPRSVHVVLARLDLIRLAAHVGAVRTSADDSLAHPVRPG